MRSTFLTPFAEFFEFQFPFHLFLVFGGVVVRAFTD